MQRLLAYTREAWDALWRNKARSILTMLGMLIGVASVNSVYGLSSGATAAINSSVSNQDFPSLTINPDPQQADPAQAQLQYRDAQILSEEGGDSITRVIPFYSTFANFQNRIYRIRQGAQRVTVFGFSWLGDDPDMKVVAGRAFTGEDVSGGAGVCMISHDLAVQFFKSDAASLGQYLIVNGSRFRIIGVPDNNNGTASNYFGGTYYMVLPYTTYQNFAPGPIDGLYVWEISTDREDEAKAAVLAVFAHTHGEAAKYTITSTRDQLQQSDKVLNIIAIGLTAIGAISLFVAGIGIMNIMLVSVTERTREIGIRKSIGANRGDIVFQFVIESALVSLIGGTIGLLLSVLLIVVVGGAMSKFTGGVIVPWGSVILSGFAFSLAVGVVFGTYPAIHASQLDPVEALRS
ncbi:MAG TPA: ABC transporter permease [Verrucomicrobiae bacterium]|jgi:putative ABC transport system permease protein|nr:ABC transporter permease [Verrucomicrobiae bacterium]